MVGIGSLVGSAMKVAGAIGGGIAARKAAKEQTERLDNLQQQNQSWFDRRYNEDATQRADAQRLITMTEEAIKNRNRQAAGASAVMGGTTESVAAAKAANNAALTDTISQIAADAADRKDIIEGQYMANNQSIVDKQNAISAQKAKAITEAIGQVGDAANAMGGVLDNVEWKKK